VEWWEALLLVFGGAAAGLINAVAGGGSTLTVPLLVLAGVPGNNANASNRVGILTSNAAAATAFRRLGVRGLSRSIPVLGPIVVGSLVGSLLITRLTDAGALYTANYRGAQSVDRFVFAGGRQALRATFSWRGCRYIEVRGLRDLEYSLSFRTVR